MNGQENLHESYLALGSNLGDRKGYLLGALSRLKAVPEKITLQGVSNIYETEPVGYTDQGNFLNMACRLGTTLKSLELLSLLQRIEKELDRTREIHWGPRTIDLDILLYDGIELHTETLTLPHPRMFERAFVLVPLRDVFPGDTVNGVSFDDLLQNCNDRNGVKLFEKAENTPSSF